MKYILYYLTLIEIIINTSGYNLCNSCKYKFLNPYDKTFVCFKSGRALSVEGERTFKFDKCDNILNCTSYELRKTYNLSHINLDKLK